MSSKVGIGWDGLKKTVNRKKQAIMAAVGHAEKTVDVAYNHEVDRFKAHYKLMKKINKDTRKYIDTLRALSVAHSQLTEDIQSLYESGSPLWQVNLKMQSNFAEIEKFRMGLEQALEEDLLNPLSEYMGQFGALNQRIDELERRCNDMDRYKTDVKKMTEKPPNNPQKLTLTQAKLKYAKAGYEELKAELMVDMPNLFNDRFQFFDPCFATLVTAQSSYYAAGNKYLGEVAGMVSKVDRSYVHRHPKVITEQTVATKPVYPPNLAGEIPDNPSPHYGKPGGPQAGGSGYNSPAVGGGAQGGAYGGSPAGYGGSPSQYHSPPVHAQSRQAQALYPFEAQSAQELSFQYGDVLTVLSQNGEWWECQHPDGRRGLVPGNYVQMLS